MLSVHRPTSSSTTTNFPSLSPCLLVHVFLPLLFVTCNYFTYITDERTRITGNTSRDHYPPLRDVTADSENAASIVACAYFRRGLEMTSFYRRVLEHVYGAVAWQWVFTLHY
jgi:hypothetical protein